MKTIMMNKLINSYAFDITRRQLIKEEINSYESK